MSKARVTFHTLIQDSQEYGSDDEFMVSRVFFTLEIDGKKFENLFADLKQTVGSDFETGSIEVSPPRGYEGRFNHAAFSEGATKYFRSLVGSKGTGVRTEGSRNIRMQNNIFKKEMAIEFEIN